MKNYSTSPTDQNAVELLKSDPLRRNNAVLRFLQLINSIDDSCSIALNGEWGSGKTIFIKQIKLIVVIPLVQPEKSPKNMTPQGVE